MVLEGPGNEGTLIYLTCKELDVEVRPELEVKMP